MVSAEGTEKWERLLFVLNCMNKFRLVNYLAVLLLGLLGCVRLEIISRRVSRCVCRLNATENIQKSLEEIISIAEDVGVEISIQMSPLALRSLLFSEERTGKVMNSEFRRREEYPTIFYIQV